MRELFAVIGLLLLGVGGALQAQDEKQDPFDHVLFETSNHSHVLGAGEEIDLKVKFSATAGDRFVISWGIQMDTVQITKTGEMVEVSHHFEEGDIIEHTLSVRAVDTGSHIIGFALEGSMFTDVAPYRCPAFRYLSLNNTSIKYLRPVLPSLQSIKCVHNPLLWELSLYECPSLKTVECVGNRSLKRLILSNNYELEEVICTYNDSLKAPELPEEGGNLKTVDYSNNNQLEYLTLSNQPALKAVKCTNNPLLESFGLYDCLAIDSLNITNNVQLKALYLINTGLRFWDLSVAPNLEELYCNENDSLTALKVDNPVLQILECDHNRLESLLLDNCTTLETLICSHNQLTSLELHPDVIVNEMVADSNSLTLSNLADLTTHISVPTTALSPQFMSVLLQVGQTLDLRGEMDINDKATQWYFVDSVGNLMAEHTDIKYLNGRFSFSKTGKYRIELAHDALPTCCGDFSSAWVFYDVTVVDSVARPVFSVPSGAVRRHTPVSLSTTTPDARIYYTIDGSAPDSAASLYTDPIFIDEAVTIKAIAIQDTFVSRVATASYTIDLTANESDRITESDCIYTKDRNIYLSESVGEVEVFTANGQCVYEGSATAIPVKRSGLYVVVAKGGRWKVAVR